MELLVQDRPALIPDLGEADAGLPPPGTENVATLLEIVEVVIFIALLVSAAAILIRRQSS